MLKNRNKWIFIILIFLVFSITFLGSATLAQGNSSASPHSGDSTVEGISGNIAENISTDEMENKTSEINEEDLSLIIEPFADNTVIVNNFTELKSILTAPPNAEKIVLAGDIQMQAGGISIHSSWTNVIIDGQDPITGNMHTITDYNSLAYTDTIWVNSANLKNITLQNVNISGKNYYGTVCVPDWYSGVTQTYQNVSYIGPQITYNQNGTVRYIDCTILIAQNGSVSAGQEVGQITNVEIGGNTTITSTSSGNSMFWFSGTTGSIRILENSSAKLETTNYLAYINNSNTTFTLENNANFEYIGKEGMTYGTMSFKSLLVGQNATFKAKKTDSSAYAVLRINTRIDVQEGGSLILYQTVANGPAVHMTSANAVINLESPKKVMFLSPSGYALQFTGAGTLTANTEAINVWTSLPNGVVDSIYDKPAQIWNQQDGSTFTTNAIFNTRAISSVTSSWNGVNTQWNGELNKNNFSLGYSKNVIFGEFYLEPDPIIITGGYVTGYVKPNSQVGIYYGTTENVVTADDMGYFSIPVDFTGLNVGDQITILTNNDQIKAYSFYEIQEGGEIKFLYAPPTINFYPQSIPAQPTYIFRENENLEIQISDTRGQGSDWRLDVSVSSPFINEEDEVLGGFLVHSEENTVSPLSEVPFTVYNGITGDNSITNIIWDSAQGILFWLSSIDSVKSDTSYNTTIDWMIIDAP